MIARRSTPDSGTCGSLRISTFCLFLLLGVAAQLSAQEGAVDTTTRSNPQIPPAPVTSLIAEDFNYDDGENIMLTWVPSIDDQPAIGGVTGYQVFQIRNDGVPEKLADLLPGANSFRAQDLQIDSTYRFYVVALADGVSSESIRTAPIRTEREWIDWNLWNLMLITLIIGGAIIVFIETAKRGKKLFVRKIAGLEAVDEAIGRATEMGRPILYIPGIQDMDDVQTLAALTILGRVAEHVATYDIKIRMPVSRSLVMTAARETIKASYQAAGRPDAYSEDMVSYVTDEQFGYVAAVSGIMVREKPATVFLLGAFMAESLILAETGNSVGAIQIAGTARPAQLPFFVAACDFTLIGEELFAASAYLSGEPRALGSLKGQDVGKAIAMVAVVLGMAAVTLYSLTEGGAFKSVADWLHTMFTIASD
ncbi:MAG: fibronectin type III domain-containing protein [Candidatus Zixiibacteriota bacterium]